MAGPGEAILSTASDETASGGQLPIEDYGAIGNLHTVALVGRNGSIDWCCLPEIDGPSVFGALLGSEAGRFCVRVPGTPRGAQRYIGDTNVLETTLESPEGRVVITDFMPIAGNIDGTVETAPPAEIHRVLHAPGGSVAVEVEWSPRFDYGATPTRIDRGDDWYIATPEGGGRDAIYLSGLPDGEVVIQAKPEGATLRARFTLAGGSTIALVTAWGAPREAVQPDHSLHALDETIDAWGDWMENEETTGELAWGNGLEQLVKRSALALKLLTHADTGAFAAAATTSLPETLGGVRNWDYRYCWIRDAGMTAQAFGTLGHWREMRDFVLWAERVAETEVSDSNIKVMYTLHGALPDGEHHLDHLEGYRDSRPVRVGNDAREQYQPDIFGELMEAAETLVRAGYHLEPDVADFLPGVADRAAARWREPDHGLWEMPREPQQYVYSKLMTWAALDRALWLEARGQIRGDTETWRAEAAAIRDWITTDGYDPDVGAFVQEAGLPHLDASSLLIPVKRLLPFDDARVQSTIDRVMEQLTANGLVYRYRRDDGLPGEEGAFVLCTFWLVDALALSGRMDEAGRIFQDVAARANHLGLFSEQIDPTTGRFLGNFPQALSHIGLIASAAYVSGLHGHEIPGPLPRLDDVQR